MKMYGKVTINIQLLLLHESSSVIIKNTISYKQYFSTLTQHHTWQNNLFKIRILRNTYKLDRDTRFFPKLYSPF